MPIYTHVQDVFIAAMKVLVCEERLDALHTDVTGNEGQSLGLPSRLAEIVEEAANDRLTAAEARQVFTESYRHFFQPVNERFARCGQDAQEQSQVAKKLEEAHGEICQDIAKLEDKISSIEQRARSNKRKIGIMTENYFALDQRVDELQEDVRKLEGVKKDMENRFEKVMFCCEICFAETYHVCRPR